MKYKLLIALFLAVFTLNAQEITEEEARDFFWGSHDKYKKANEIPEKWKNESAVIIYKNVNYDYHKYGKRVKYTSSFRKRIKLLDKNAVTEYSEFSFAKKFRSTKGKYTFRTKGKVFFAIKIIKPDGKEIDIDVDKEAVKEKEDYKIAISNLEVGDIIDYYYYMYEPFKSKFQFTFEAVEQTLSEEYPIMDFKLYLESENDFFINFQSLNGAPELKELATDKNNFRKYELIASDIEKNDFPIWYFPLVETPSLKFQVYFARSGKFEDNTVAFLSKDEANIKSSVSKDEILDLYDRRFRATGRINDVRAFLKDKNYSTDEEMVTAAYYYMRHYYLTRFVEAMYVDDAKIMSYPFSVYKYPVYIGNQIKFIKHFSYFLKDNDIDYEIVVGTKKYNGKIQDLLIENNVDVFVKVKTKKPLYAKLFSPHTNINQFSPLLHGTDVYLLSANSKGKIDGISSGTLPQSNYNDNVESKIIDIEMNSDFSGFKASILTKAKGYRKIKQQYNKMMFSDYVNEDYAMYKTKTFTEKIKNKKARTKVEKELNALVLKIKKTQKEKFEEQAKNEYDASEDVKDYNFEIINTGRYGLNEEFEFKETFSFKNQYIKKAGPNYIVEVGKLIGGQIEIDEKNRKRNVDVYMD